VQVNGHTTSAGLNPIVQSTLQADLDAWIKEYHEGTIPSGTLMLRQDPRRSISTFALTISTRIRCPYILSSSPRSVWAVFSGAGRGRELAKRFIDKFAEKVPGGSPAVFGRSILRHCVCFALASYELG
jgi:hypothetical protein